MYIVRDAIIDKGPDWDLYNDPDTPIANAKQALQLMPRPLTS